jgi:hypothetical protein
MPAIANTMPVPISAAALAQEDHVTLMRGPETKLSC